MKTLKYFLLFSLAISMGVACTKDDDAPGGKKPDDTASIDSLKKTLAGKWLDVSPDGDRNVYVFLSDTIYRKNVCSELTDTLLYQVVAKDTVRIAALGAIAHYSKIIVHNNDSITIADITLRRLAEGEEVECDVILPPCNSGTEYLGDYECMAAIGGDTSDTNIRHIGFGQLTWDTEPMPYLVESKNRNITFYRICNYPEYAKAWKIPAESFIPVIITGKRYRLPFSFYHPAIPGYPIFYDLELVTLKKKK